MIAFIPFLFAFLLMGSLIFAIVFTNRRIAAREKQYSKLNAVPFNFEDLLAQWANSSSTENKSVIEQFIQSGTLFRGADGKFYKVKKNGDSIEKITVKKPLAGTVPFVPIVTKKSLDVE